MFATGWTSGTGVTAKVIGIGQLRSETCDFIHRVQCGETFVIVRRGRPVARLQAFTQSAGSFSIPVPLNVLRTRASRLIDRVSAGETIAIEHHGRTVAVMRALRGPQPTRPRRLSASVRPTALS